ncbi:hypothetical protein I4U23_012668 [Adineta vaga]|nr:hypothetical protein I4U23_012668 [Adineta vaga]
MTTNNNTVPSSTKKTKKNDWDPIKDSEKQKFCVQEKPPLSLCQSLRSTISVNPSGKQWKPSGVYNPPVIYDDTPPPKVTDEQPKVEEVESKIKKPAWYPAGVVKYKQPKLSGEENNSGKKEDKETTTDPKPRSKSKDKHIAIPWRPSGNPEYEPVLYFDPPSLRWSSKQIKETMPEFQSTSKKSATNQK